MSDKKLQKVRKLNLISAMHEVTFDKQMRDKIKFEIEKVKTRQLNYGLLIFPKGLLWEMSNEQEEVYKKEFLANYEQWRVKNQKNGIKWSGLYVTGILLALLGVVNCFNQRVLADTAYLDKEAIRLTESRNEKITVMDLRISGSVSALFYATCCGYFGFRGYKNAQKIYVMRSPRVTVDQKVYE